MTTASHARIAAAPIRLGAAAITGWSSYLLGLLRRGATPCTVIDDSLRFASAVTSTTPPRWATDWPVVLHHPLARMRDCSRPDADGREDVPTLLLPPQTGTASCIVDYTPGRSQVEALRAGGLTRLHCIEWTPGTSATDAASIDEHLAVIASAVEHLGGRVDLVGDSQGGWLGTIYAALHPERVRSLTVAGAPIDFHLDQPALAAMAAHAPASATASALDLWYGAARLTGLQTTDPVGEIERAMTLLANLDDPEEVARWEAERSWFAWKQDIPAAFREWIMRRLFAGNELVAGTLVAQGRTVTLSSIECPVHLIAGTTDLLATPRQVTALAEHVSTPADRITTTIVDAGHIGLFIGRRALAEAWRPHGRRLRAVS